MLSVIRNILNERYILHVNENGMKNREQIRVWDEFHHVIGISCSASNIRRLIAIVHVYHKITICAFSGQKIMEFDGSTLDINCCTLDDNCLLSLTVAKLLSGVYIGILP